MANLQNILGTMLATGMGGRSNRGPSFATGNTSGMGVGNAVGLASLGYLAYKAWQERQQNMRSTSTQAPTGNASTGGIFGGGGLGGIAGTIFGGGAAPGTAAPASPAPGVGGGPSLGERLIGA